MENNSIEMKIAKVAASNWGQQEPTTIEEAKGITWGSEVAAINGMARVLDLDSEDARVQTKIANIRSTLEDLWITYQFQVEGYVFRCYSLIFELIYILIHSFSQKVDRKELKKNQEKA